MKRKYGKFTVPMKMVDNIEVMSAVMQKIIVIRAEAIYYSKTIEYHAYCEDFREIDEGEIIPNYLCVISHDSESDSFSVSFQE